MPLILGILAQGVGAAPGAAGAYDLLETTTFTTSTASVSFTNLDSYSDYKHLQVRAALRSQYALRLEINDDTGASYRTHRLNGDGSSVSSSTNASTGFMLFGGSPFGNTASQGGAFVMDILDFSTTSKNTTVRFLGGTKDTAETFISLDSGAWFNTSAVTKLEFSAFNGFDSGRFSLYGIR